MRVVEKVNYTRESDVSEYRIYAFRDIDDIAILSKKDGKFFWKCLTCVCFVWYQNYDSVEAAIEEVVLIKDYKSRKCGVIMEFNSVKEFLMWACEKTVEDVLDSSESVSKEAFTVGIKPIDNSEKQNFWHGAMAGMILKVRPATSGDLRGKRDFDGYFSSDVVIVVDPVEYEGMCLLRKYCEFNILKPNMVKDFKKLEFNDLDLSVRTLNCLFSAKIKTIGDILTAKPSELLKRSNFGKKSLLEISCVLAKYGYVRLGDKWVVDDAEKQLEPIVKGDDTFFVKIKLEDSLNSSYWYKPFISYIFKVRQAKFSDKDAVENFGNTPIGEVCVVVADANNSSSYVGKAILLKHCLKLKSDALITVDRSSESYRWKVIKDGGIKL